MKRVIVLLFVLSFVIIFANSCLSNDHFLRITHTENQNWRADEIDLTFSWGQSGWVNGSFIYDGIEYPVAIYSDIYGFSITAFIYQDASNLEESFDTIYFRVKKVIDNNTFILKVDDTYRKILDIPKTVTFRRIVDDQTVSTD